MTQVTVAFRHTGGANPAIVRSCGDSIPAAINDVKNSDTPELSRTCFAEKLLANADRGRDEVTRSRDLIDGAFMAAAWPIEDLVLGRKAAAEAYGGTVQRELAAALTRFEDGRYRRRCISDLTVEDPRRFGRGLRKLGEFLRSGSS